MLEYLATHSLASHEHAVLTSDDHAMRLILSAADKSEAETRYRSASTRETSFIVTSDKFEELDASLVSSVRTAWPLTCMLAPVLMPHSQLDERRIQSSRGAPFGSDPRVCVLLVS